MNTYNIGDTVMFSSIKGTVKIGIVKDIKSILHQDEYEDVYSIELETGKIHYVDQNHMINKVGV
jgi:hypothetical protein